MPPALDSSTTAAAISTPTTAATNAISSVVLNAALVSVLLRTETLRRVWSPSVRVEVAAGEAAMWVAPCGWMVRASGAHRFSSCGGPRYRTIGWVRKPGAAPKDLAVDALD